jgi:pyruvate/2-oxoglutarate dehydrogenase complex dihydrolipoamide dehydrogenase (E3) component
LAAALAAFLLLDMRANSAKKVGIADYVEPTPQGSKWGLGGTCVNVGCIPKKMMHYSAILAECREDMNLQGWEIDQKQNFKWEKL